MSPELVVAIKERITTGHAKEAIKTSVLAMGHEETVFEAAYTLALHDLEAAVTPKVTSCAPTLPSAYGLLTQAFLFVCKRFDVVLFVLMPGLLFFVLSYVSEKEYGSQVLVTAIDVAVVIAFLAYLVSMFTVMYMASREETPTYTEGLLWTRRHIFSLLGVSILMLFVVLGGFLLLIVPGIILLVSLYFSQYALMLEEQKGVAALARSHALVQGRFFAVALKLFAFMLYFLFPIFLITAIFTAISLINPVLQKFTLAGDIGTEFASALFTVVGAFAMGHLYRAMQVGRPLTEPSTARKGLYFALSMLGVVAIGVIIALTFFFQSFLRDAVTGDSFSLQSEIQSMSLAAQLYAIEHDNSFEGVCDSLRTGVASADLVECNDNETAWAIVGVIGEERFCADTTTTGKQVKSALGDRLTCLNLPKKQPTEAAKKDNTDANGATTTTSEAETSME